MHKRIAQQGLEIVPQILIVTRLIPDSKGTSCNQRLEKINGTTNAQILRVPFRQENGEVLQQWVSRSAVPPCPLPPTPTYVSCMLARRKWPRNTDLVSMFWKVPTYMCQLLPSEEARGGGEAREGEVWERGGACAREAEHAGTTHQNV